MVPLTLSGGASIFLQQDPQEDLPSLRDLLPRSWILNRNFLYQEGAFATVVFCQNFLQA